MLDALLLDPFEGAGWQAVVLLAVTVAVLSIGFGYATYLLLFAKESMNSLAYLQSVGMSKGHLAGLLAFENLIIAAAGMGLGTWAGFQVSELMVSPLAVTESGESVIPPFILRTDWWIMGPTYAMFTAIFAGSAALLMRAMTRLDLQAIARAGES
jgi:ABC-type lipoprotein release transport system permease subunit